MTRKAAREIVDATPAKLRSAFMRNQGILPTVIGYDLAGRAIAIGSRAAERGRRQIMGNPEAAAAEAYESFHGHPPESDVVIATERHEHTTLTGIGELVWMVVRYECEDDAVQDVMLDGFNGALLAMNERHESQPQLFIEGGDQAVSLKQFEISTPVHEYETLGRMVCVSYFTRKDHLGDQGGKAEYVHVIEPPLDDLEFKEWGLKDLGMTWEEIEEETEGAVGPDVIYDTRNKALMFSGGSYQILPEGIER